MEVGEAGNHLISLGVAYTHGKSCQQLIKEVGGGESFEGEELGGLRAHRTHHPVSSRAQPAGRAVGSAPSLTLKGDPKQRLGDNSHLLQQ